MPVHCFLTCLKYLDQHTPLFRNFLHFDKQPKQSQSLYLGMSLPCVCAHHCGQLYFNASSLGCVIVLFLNIQPIMFCGIFFFASLTTELIVIIVTVNVGPNRSTASLTLSYHFPAPASPSATASSQTRKSFIVCVATNIMGCVCAFLKSILLSLKSAVSAFIVNPPAWLYDMLFVQHF